MKQVTVSILASGQLMDRTIAPGTTAADLLRDVNLPNGLLSKKPEGDYFANSDSVYDKISDGEKLFASSPASVGSSFFETIISKTLQKLDSNRVSMATNKPGIRSGVVRHSGSVVQRNQIPYWQERGWKRRDGTYTGNYVSAFGAYAGCVSQASSREMQFFIQNPPQCVLASSHSACFSPRGGGNWFSIHMSKRPQDVSSGILTIERLISECFRHGA